MSNPYDIEDAFAAIEEELIESMMRNMKRHKAEEDVEGIQWEMWQAKQLEALERYKKANRKKFSGRFSDINNQIVELIRESNKNGYMDQEIKILEAIKNGFKGYRRASDTLQGDFFRLNERKLEALIQATTNDMQKAETAILRMADDKYRQVIFNAQVYANTGAGTYEKAVDMATKDMLMAGLNCVEYSNGARHTLKDYADMAIRTASKRAYLQGEGLMRQEWGISTVIMNKRGNPCPKCLPFCGKVLIDDVWSGGSRKDGPYPLMSTAIAAGLYHPRCKDSHTTYFDGISTPPDDKYTKKEVAEIERQYAKEQKQLYAKRQVEKFGRLAKFSMDPDNQKKYESKEKQWFSIANNSNFDIIKLQEEKDTIKVINNIERRNNVKGKPAAIAKFGMEINKRQRRLLERLSDYDTSVIVKKKEVSMFDLAALTAETGVEYAMFTKNGQRLIIRGDEFSVNVTVERAKALYQEGYRWSGHTHPGEDEIVLIPSDGDKAILDVFEQECSVIFNSSGKHALLEKE